MITDYRYVVVNVCFFSRELFDFIHSCSELVVPLVNLIKTVKKKKKAGCKKGSFLSYSPGVPLILSTTVCIFLLGKIKPVEIKQNNLSGKYLKFSVLLFLHT